MADVELEQLTLVRSEFPVYAGTLEQQLYAAWKDSEVRIRKYVGDFRYSSDEAAAILDEIGIWISQHRGRFITDLANPVSQTVSSDMALDLGAKKVRQYVVALYSEAARGLGPWLGEMVSQNVIQGQESFAMAQQEAVDRLAAFGTIRRMDEEGILQQVFYPEEAMADETMGLTMHAASPNAYAMLAIKAGAVVLTVLGIAAISWFAYDKLSTKRLAAANEQRAKNCSWAKSVLANKSANPAELDMAEDVMEWCMETTSDLQKKDPDPLSDAIQKILIAAAIAGAGYLAITLLPPLLASSTATSSILASSKRGD